jgi:hypothetical protein
MTAIAGPIQAVSIDGREFPATQAANGARHLGGYKAEQLPNGNFTARLQLTPGNWYLTGVEIEIDDDRDDQRFIQNVIDGATNVVLTATYTSGLTYQGTGMVTGDHDYANETGTATINFAGSGRFTKQ